MKPLILTTTVLAIALLGSGCASISEDDCQIGAWSEYGYKDGLSGRSSARVAKYAEKCGEFGVRPDQDAYLSGYERGVILYCTYERGYALGENGDSYNQVCSGALAADFAPGYDAGRAIFEIYKEHTDLIDSYEDTVDALVEVRRKLREDELEDGERRRLIKKELRLENRADDKRIDIRAFERINNLRRHRFD